MDDFIDTPTVNKEKQPTRVVETKKQQVNHPIPLDDLKYDDFLVFVKSYIDFKGLITHQLESMEHFYTIGIRQIITEVFKIEVKTIIPKNNKTKQDQEIEYISFAVKFTNVEMTRPTTTNKESNKPHALMPNQARLQDLTYSADLYVDAEISAVAHLKGSTKTIDKVENISKFKLASIPIMVRTSLCNTYRCTRETLIRLQEDPDDLGGYFIISGNEWAVDNLENVLLNHVRVFKNLHKNEIVRGEIISKPGDGYENSFYSIVRYLKNGGITIDLTTTTNKQHLEMPFFLLFKAFGITQDKTIANYIAYGVDNGDPLTISILNILNDAFTAEYKEFKTDNIYTVSETEAIDIIARKLSTTANDEQLRRNEAVDKYVRESTTKYLDTYIFPHIGSDASSRVKKLLYYGHIIRKVILVQLGVMDSTDRDSYDHKRVHSAGVSLAKTFKSQ